MSEKKLNLFQKLIEIRKNIPYLQKLSRNAEQKFDYVSASQMMAAVRPLLDEYGILIVPHVKEHYVLPAYDLGDRGKMVYVLLTIHYEVIDAESGERMVVEWCGHGSDTHEKGVGKALTYALKYFFFQLLDIPTDADDPDAWEEKVAASAPKAAKANVLPEDMDGMLRDISRHIGAEEFKNAEAIMFTFVAGMKGLSDRVNDSVLQETRKRYTELKAKFDAGKAKAAKKALDAEQLPDYKDPSKKEG